MAERPNAFRAIRSDLVDFYVSDPNKIPDIEGTHFIALNSVKKFNNCGYDADKKYLHFFPSERMAENYAKGLAQELSKKEYRPINFSVVGFFLPPEILANYSFFGVYERANGETFLQNEFIVPIDLYDPSLHFVKVMSEVKSNYRYNPDDYGPMM